VLRVEFTPAACTKTPNTAIPSGETAASANVEYRSTFQWTMYFYGSRCPIEQMFRSFRVISSPVEVEMSQLIIVRETTSRYENVRIQVFHLDRVSGVPEQKSSGIGGVIVDVIEVGERVV
jgi:hypothetical protein